MADLAWGLWRRGYDAVADDRARRGGRHSYPSRLLGRRAVVLSGVEGARLFYDEEVVRRAGAVPPPLGYLLFGRGAVHGTDDAEHRWRKQLFVAPLHGADVDDLAVDHAGLPVAVLGRWPDRGWPGLLDRAVGLVGEDWKRWCDGGAADRFVTVVRRLAAGDAA